MIQTAQDLRSLGASKIEKDFLAGLHKSILLEAEWEAENDSTRKGFWKTALMLPMLSGTKTRA